MFGLVGVGGRGVLGDPGLCGEGMGVGVPALDGGSGMSNPARVGVSTGVFTVVFVVVVVLAEGSLLCDTGGVCSCLSTDGGVRSSGKRSR